MATDAPPKVTEEPLFVYNWLCPYVHRVSLALAFKKASLTKVDIDLRNKPSWLPHYSPHGKVPAITYLEGGKQQILYESLALVFWVEEYFSKGASLLPPSAAQRAKARIIAARYDGVAIPLWYQGLKSQTQEEFSGLLNKLRGELTWLEQNTDLADGSAFLLGKEPTVVDAVVAPWLLRTFLFQHYKNVDLLAQHPKLKAYAERFRQLPEVQATFLPPGGGGYEGWVSSMNEGYITYAKQQLDFSSVDNGQGVTASS